MEKDLGGLIFEKMECILFRDLLVEIKVYNMLNFEFKYFVVWSNIWNEYECVFVMLDDKERCDVVFF